jgi:hypothetical protein
MRRHAGLAHATRYASRVGATARAARRPTWRTSCCSVAPNRGVLMPHHRLGAATAEAEESTPRWPPSRSYGLYRARPMAAKRDTSPPRACSTNILAKGKVGGRLGARRGGPEVVGSKLITSGPAFCKVPLLARRPDSRQLGRARTLTLLRATARPCAARDIGAARASRATRQSACSDSMLDALLSLPTSVYLSLLDSSSSSSSIGH